MSKLRPIWVVDDDGIATAGISCICGWVRTAETFVGLSEIIAAYDAHECFSLGESEISFGEDDCD